MIRKFRKHIQLSENHFYHDFLGRWPCSTSVIRFVTLLYRAGIRGISNLIFPTILIKKMLFFSFLFVYFEVSMQNVSAVQAYKQIRLMWDAWKAGGFVQCEIGSDLNHVTLTKSQKNVIETLFHIGHLLVVILMLCEYNIKIIWNSLNPS